MHIDRYHPAALRDEPLEVSIVIDVMRATTTAAALLSRGIGQLAVVAVPEDLARLPAPAHGSYLLFSELDAATAWGERLDNSPALAEEVDLAGRSPVLVTTNGTRAMHAAVTRSEIGLLAAFVNLRAVVRHVAALRPSRVAILPAGHFATAEMRTEDERCADALEALLRGEEPDLAALLSDCRADARLQRRLARTPELERDVAISLDVDRYEVVAALELARDSSVCLARSV